jgi:hypothetical protein
LNSFKEEKVNCIVVTMATSAMSVEDRVSNFIEDILKVEDIRESFNVFLVIKKILSVLLASSPIT